MNNIKAIEELSDGWSLLPEIKGDSVEFTVPKGEERLRICFHEFNTKEDVDLLISKLNQF